MTRAQTYPSRPVRLVVGFAAGGGQDLIARLIGQGLSKRLGQQFVIDNRPGAGTIAATEAVVNAPADGYTLLLVTPASAVNPSLYDRMRYDFLGDITPVWGLVRATSDFAIHPSFSAATALEFVAHAKPNPGKLNTAFFGTPATAHTPSISELVNGYEVSGWTGVGAPKNTPRNIIDLLNSEISTVLAGAKAQACFEELGSTELPMSSAEFGKFIAEESEKLAKVIRAANIRVG
jgi:tripartite-type tricarboxylate transporter receptor subunit TctC